MFYVRYNISIFFKSFPMLFLKFESKESLVDGGSQKDPFLPIL